MATAPEYSFVGYEPIGETIQFSGEVGYATQCKKSKLKPFYLLLGTYRILVFKLKHPKKTERCVHFFDIVSIKDVDILPDCVSFTLFVVLLIYFSFVFVFVLFFLLGFFFFFFFFF